MSLNYHSQVLQVYSNHWIFWLHTLHPDKISVVSHRSYSRRNGRGLYNRQTATSHMNVYGVISQRDTRGNGQPVVTCDEWCWPSLVVSERSGRPGLQEQTTMLHQRRRWTVTLIYMRGAVTTWSERKPSCTSAILVNLSPACYRLLKGQGSR